MLARTSGVRNVEQHPCGPPVPSLPGLHVAAAKPRKLPGLFALRRDEMLPRRLNNSPRYQWHSGKPDSKILDRRKVGKLNGRAE
jgi:hypothetical protein